MFLRSFGTKKLRFSSRLDPTHSFPRVSSFTSTSQNQSNVTMANHYSYQSSHSNSNDQVMYTSNRSRSESGSSDSSRGSGNSGKPRRRSHRPRGCRGGSNRRKQKNAEGGNKQHFKKTYSSDFKNRVHGKFSQPLVNQNNYAGPSEEEFFTKNSNNGPQNNFRQGCLHKNPDNACNIVLLDYPHPKSAISTTSGLPFGGNIHGHSQQKGFYRNNAPRYVGESDNDYPLLQSSFSESSSESIIENRDAILPPLPSDDLFDRPHQIIPGPNPYALKSSGAGSMIDSHPVYPTYGGPTPTTAPTIVLPVSRPQPQFVDSTPDVTMLLPGLQQARKDIDFNYRAQRLEKQRQSVVGGSLFVTSPRSFLMSCKSSFHE